MPRRGRRRVRFRAALVLAFALTAAVSATAASASALITRNAQDVTLAVNAREQALVSFRVAGRLEHVLAWGAVNAIAPTPNRRQVEFELDYTGGAHTYHTAYWKSFRSRCGSYDGPQLAWNVAACKAPDGSYWALQAWQRELPVYGVQPTPAQAVWELRLSHWTGPPPVLWVSTDWAWRRFDHLYGRFTYRGQPVHGFHSSRGGNPLDTYGRNVYIDTFDSAYGTGWHRENGALTHNPTGVFCYSLNPHGAHPAGKGSRYRVTVIGPGVTPDVMWDGISPGRFNRTREARARRELASLGDRLCS
jgi:hypothetical protein